MTAARLRSLLLLSVSAALLGGCALLPHEDLTQWTCPEDMPAPAVASTCNVPTPSGQMLGKTVHESLPVAPQSAILFPPGMKPASNESASASAKPAPLALAHPHKSHKTRLLAQQDRHSRHHRHIVLNTPQQSGQPS